MKNLREAIERIFLAFQMPTPSDSLSERMNGVPSTSIYNAVESVLKEVVESYHHDCKDEKQICLWTAKREGKIEGLEQAARVAETYVEFPTKNKLAMEYRDACMEAVAIKIRALMGGG